MWSLVSWFGGGRNREPAGGSADGTGEVVDAFVEMLSARDPVTGEHVNRVACLATEIALLHGMDEDALYPVEVGARLHDLGKLGIPDAILKKPDRLSDEEWAVMKRHPSIGASLLRSTPQLAHLAEVVEAHHERWDGTGYPHGLAGERIPVEARIFAIADSIDAMTVDRPYDPARSWDYVGTELETGAGTQWDPAIARLAHRSLDRLAALTACPHGRPPQHET